MFATGLPRLGESFFTASSMAIAVPSGVQIFCWLATIWGGRPVFATPLLFVLGFFFIFVLGGLTGVMVASVPLDTQVHDTYFVVAHFHYVLIGGAVFPLIGAIYYWFPKITGRMMSERLGRWVVLAGLRRLQPRPSSRCTSSGCRACRAASTPIQPEMGWGGAQPVRQPERPACSPPASCCSSSTSFAASRSRAAGRRQSLGRADAGMGDRLAAAALQFRPHPGRRPAASRCGTSRTRCRWRPACACDRRELVITSVAEAQPEAREVVAAELDLAVAGGDRHERDADLARSSRPGRWSGARSRSPSR